MSIQYLNLSQSVSATEGLQGTITDTTQGSAVNITDALADASKTLSRDLFYGQNKVIVFGMDYAKSHIDKGIDYLLRSTHSRPDVLVAVSSKKAEEIIKNKQRDARIPAENVYNLLEVGEESGQGSEVTVNDLLNYYNDETSDIYFPIVESKSDNVACKGVVVFSENNYAAQLDEEQTFGFLFVKNRIKGGAISVKSDELGMVGLDINSSKTKRSAEVKNGKITFICDVKTSLILNEVERGIDIEIDEKQIENLQKLVNKRIKEIMLSAINTCIENKSDPLLISRYVAKYDETFYNSVKNNWRDNMKNIDVNVNVESSIQRINSNAGR